MSTLQKITMFIFLTAIYTPIFAENSQREIIYVDSASREFIINEMQENLNGIQKALTALSKDDMFAVAEALRPLGMKGMMHVPKSLKKSLPMGFKKLGMPLHMAFDKIANKAEMGAASAEILTDLSAAMANCVACHSAYTIKPK